MKKTFGLLLGAVLGWQIGSADAWWDEGHMRVAAIAWEQLTPNAKAEAVRLIKLNRKYPEWAAAVPVKADGTPGDVDRLTFIRAATWADDIKLYKDYKDKSDAENDNAANADACQNIGYSDLLIHGYWHFVDYGFSTDGTPVLPPDPVNAETQIKLFTTALQPTAHTSDDVKSYDLVWLLHLVGDVHQPLHATTLFTQYLPKGDVGGNALFVQPANGNTTKLHFYWDGMFGGYSTVVGAINDTFGNLDEPANLKPAGDPSWPPPAALANEMDPHRWIQESAALAQRFAYDFPAEGWGGPNSGAQTPVPLSREYETLAYQTGRAQNDLAGVRLAKGSRIPSVRRGDLATPRLRPNSNIDAIQSGSGRITARRDRRL